MKRTKKDLSSELIDLRKQVKKAEAASPIEAQQKQFASQQALERIGNRPIEGIVQDFTTAGLSITKALSGLGEQALAEGQKLEDLRLAVTAKEEELQRLYGAEVVSESLAEMLTRHDLKKKELAAEIKSFEEEMAERKKELQRELQQERQKSDHSLEMATGEQTFQQQQQHKEREQQFNDKLAQRMRQLRDDEELKQRDWARREESLQEREAELNDLRARVAEFPEQLKKEAEKQVAMATSVQKRNYEHTLALKDQETASKIALAQQEVLMLQRENTGLKDEIERLRDELKSSKAQIENIASKALQAAEGGLARDAIMRMGQGGNGPSTTARK